MMTHAAHTNTTKTKLSLVAALTIEIEIVFHFLSLGNLMMLVSLDL